MDDPFDRVIAALQARGATIRGLTPDKIRASCPAHADAKPSLAVTRVEGGVLLHCFAGCPKGVPARALGFQPRELFTGTRQTKPRAAIEASYDYFGRDGQLVQKVRFTPKQFAWRRSDPAARTGWRWGLNRPLAGLHLYRAPELRGQHLVFVVEGEKAVDAMMRIDLVATCGPGGASTWNSNGTADLFEAVAGEATIAILPDNDRPGERHAERVAADLHDHVVGKTVVVKVVVLPVVSTGADVVDWLAGAHTRDELLELVTSTPAWAPGATARQRAKRRVDQQRQRREQHRQANQSINSIPTRVSREVRLEAALTAVLHELQRVDQPRSGRQLKAALAGRHQRDVIDAALRHGIEIRAVTLERGPRHTNLYRPGAYIHRLQASGHSTTTPDTRLSNFSNQTRVSECPEAVKPEARVNSFFTLQDSLSSSLNTPASAAGHSQEREEASGVRTLERTKGGVVPRKEADTPAGERRCCEGRPLQLRCQLCPQSPTYWQRREAEPYSTRAAGADAGALQLRGEDGGQR